MLGVFRRLPDAVGKRIFYPGNGLRKMYYFGKFRHLCGMMETNGIYKKVEGRITHLLERKCIVVFGLHVLRILVMHFQEIYQG